MENQELWKDIEECEGLYQISNAGKVKSLKNKKERILKPYLINGYCAVILCVNGIRKYSLVHRLVAVAFIKNPNKKRTINHKKGIKSDNRFTELEWATYAENMQHAYDNKLIHHVSSKNNPQSKPIYQYTKDNKFIRRYDSTNQASVITGISQPSINCVALGSKKSAGGYLWKRN